MLLAHPIRLGATVTVIDGALGSRWYHAAFFPFGEEWCDLVGVALPSSGLVALRDIASLVSQREVLWVVRSTARNRQHVIYLRCQRVRPYRIFRNG